MSSTAGTELSRVTIVAPHRRIDLSLPADVPLAHMLPTLLRVAGPNLADAGLAHSGWVLQRLDDAPFDPGRSLSQLGVRDGEILYFRPGMAQIPEMSFDDVADVIATGIKDRSDRWRPHSTRSFGLGAAGAALAVGAVAVVLSGPPWIAPAIAAGIVAFLLLIGAMAVSRAFGDSGAGAVLGYAALPYGFLAGLLAPARSGIQITHVGAPHLLAGFSAAMLVAVIAGFSVADGVPVFLGAAIAAAMGAVGSGLGYAFPNLPAAGVAGTVAAVVMAFTGLIPTLSFRLARLPLPAVPTSAEDLRRDTELVDGRAVLKRTTVADRYATGLAAAVAMVAMGGMLFLAASPKWSGPTTAAAMAVSLLLRARIFRGREQRVWMLTSGLVGLGALDIGLALRGGQVTTLAGVLLPLLLLAGIVVGLAMWLPGHRPTPFWGRAGDIIDMIVIIALLPLALAALDLYSTIRGLKG
ncbi:type VII secretion integral membrane protein EccD [Actinoallomurus purpureus]|uniref:type VII secretion integral membrane protein EccD n=1 Tax=Actinoallomurus purpureus TaxID=478114 RepID=UPI0020939934|nr:type VII secretion integral membrane protein EccD [Actinoallomurus purpureus]MCO6011609.1 type VII secretion integral membrane protein EccD [Actinoallomurus purpureus]